MISGSLTRNMRGSGVVEGIAEMRAVLAVAVLGVLGLCLSGCVAVDVASAGIGAATTVVSTTVDVTSTVVKGAAHTVAGSSDDSDKDKKSDDDDK